MTWSSRATVRPTQGTSASSSARSPTDRPRAPTSAPPRWYGSTRTSHEAADNLAFPNGTVITADGSTLVIAESMGRCLTAFDRSPDGTLSGRRVWATLPEGVAPDGICLCADDTIWVANALGSEFVRVAEGGDIVERITTATGLGAFACMLGDEDRTTLYMCTAATSDQVKAQERRTGCIEKARTTVPGVGLP